MNLYVASRASVSARGVMWRALRASGVPISSSWIDEDGPGETPCMGALWERIEDEVNESTGLVLYLERSDLPLKGALVEVGMAIAGRIPIAVVAPDIDPNDRRSLIGSWSEHPRVGFYMSVADAVSALTPCSPNGGVR